MKRRNARRVSSLVAIACGLAASACSGGDSRKQGGEISSHANGASGAAPDSSLDSPGVSCQACPLRLFLLNKQAVDGSTQRVTLAVDYAPAEADAKPRLADFRLKSSHEMTVVDAAPGEALSQAGKVLYVDAQSKKPWRKRKDGSYQFAILSTENANRLASGRLLTVTADLPAGSASFYLQKRDLTFAPLEADLAIRSTPYDTPVLVEP